MKLRIPVNELTLADLQAHPVWEYAIDEEGEDDADETTVRPYDVRPVDPGAVTAIVRAKFRFADTTEAFGFVTPSAEGVRDPGIWQPCVITAQGHVSLWRGGFAPSESDLAALYRKLGKPAGDVFPLTFATDVDGVLGTTSGEIAGFMVYRDSVMRVID